MKNKKEGPLIHRKEGEWDVWYREDGSVALRVQFPPNMTPDEFEKFCEHLLKLAKERQHGPN